MHRGNACQLSVLALLASMGFAQAQDITIAVAGPMTGSVASIGEQLKHGAELAAQAVNKAGGVNGRNVKLVVYDDACDPKQAVAIANRIVSDGIKFVEVQYKDRVRLHLPSSCPVKALLGHVTEKLFLAPPSVTNSG